MAVTKENVEQKANDFFSEDAILDFCFATSLPFP